ncbi:MAG: hypothetical protein ACLPUT_11450 [Solirubrobacteraceae bacterium]
MNRAVELLAGVSPADAVRALRAEHGLSERQARRYVNAARATPDGLVVPERTVLFTVRLAPSLIAGLRRHADARGLTLSATLAEAARLRSPVVEVGFCVELGFFLAYSLQKYGRLVALWGERRTGRRGRE